MANVVEESEARNALMARGNHYEMSLRALVFPIPGFVFFNGVIASCMALIGHPRLAAAAFISAMAADLAGQALVRRWTLTADSTPQSKGLARVSAWMCVRTLVSLAPLAGLPLTGGYVELLLFTAQIISLVAVGQAMGALSRRLFWAYIGPIVAATAAIAAWRLTPGPAAGVLITLCGVTLVLWNISRNTSLLMHASRAAFQDKDAMLAELQAARDEARQATRAKSEFLATMSHEIRTPMNGVLGMAQLLKRDETSPAQRERLDVLIDSGHYLLSILNDILDVSKIDAGRLDIVPAPEDLRGFLDRVVNFWGARADEKGVALALRVSDGLPRAVLMDSLRVRQVLFNLVGNALKFTEAGMVEIIADAKPNGDGATLLRLSVRDTGPGIEAEHLPTLFDRFSQADPSEVRRFGGTGLGLAIARQLVGLMNGRIWVESEFGRGSTFHVELPLTLTTLAPDVPAEPAVEAAVPAARALNVLCVDDNHVNLLVLEQLLGSLGCRVVKAPGGAEALEIAAHEAFDLVLMDIQMPGMTGIDALQRLRAGDGPNAQAPVVALTADVTSGGRERYVALGFDEHASKPIQLEELAAAMSRAAAQDPRAALAA